MSVSPLALLQHTWHERTWSELSEAGERKDRGSEGESFVDLSALLAVYGLIPQ